MSLYQPTQVYPSSLSGYGDGVVDATKPLEICWQVNGFEPLVAYQIVIYQNDAVSTQKFDTGKVTLVDPFYGTNRKGERVLFQANAITAAQLSSAGIVNGYANGYKFLITQWWNNSDHITQTSASVFITRAEPTVTIDAISSPVTSKDISITATYTQTQGDSLSWVRWVLRGKDGIIEDTGRVNTGLLQFDYDGLFSGNTYSIECEIETENGVIATSGEEEFSVEYTVAPSQGLVDVCKRAGTPYVEISWTDRTAINGEPTGEYSIINGLLRLPEGSSVTWSENEEQTISFPPEWSFVWRGQIPNPKASYVTLVDLTSGAIHYQIKVRNSSVSLAKDGTTLFTQNLTLSANDTLVLAFTKDHWYLKQVTYTGGLYPSSTLYPSATLYPTPATKVINNWDGTLTYDQTDITGITLNGEQWCEYAWLYNGEFSANALDNLMGGEWYEPQYDADTYFIATFSNNNLSADITGGNGDVLYGTSIYRLKDGDNSLQFIADVPGGYVVARDYGCCAGEKYTYYVYLRGQQTYVAAPYVSSAITPGFNFYTLMECVPDEAKEKVYHPIQALLVAGNLSQSAVDNNNMPTILNNFTRYPLRQPSPSLYKSGTLTSLIGAIDYGNNLYSDTWELADRIQNLSLTENKLFLRDMKGALWEIHTNGSISMSVSHANYAQPIQMSFPWVEVGDASDISIVSLPTDDLWEKDGVIDTTFSVDIGTGELLWTYPDNYSGTSFVVSTGGELIAIGNGLTDIADMHINEDGELIATV